MVFTLDIPEEIARALTGGTARSLPSRALQALAVVGYRDRQLTQKQVGDLLGLGRIQTEDFLAAHIDLYDDDPAELAREAEQLKDFSEHPHP
jgi:hypothetical protein